jgi:vancomycin resistance protein YoaR
MPLRWLARLGRSAPRMTLTKSALSVAVAVAAGLGIGFLLVPRARFTDPKELPIPEVRLLGSPLAPGEGKREAALERVRRFAAGNFQLELPDGKRREIQLGELGAEIDKVRLAELVKNSHDRTSFMLRLWRAGGEAGPLSLPVPITLNPSRALPALRALKDELDRLPTDARLDLEARKLVPEINGRLLDLDSSLSAIEHALLRGERSARLVFLERKPKRLASELGNVAFDDVLGYFETRYDRSERYRARSFNLRLAASKIDGYVLLPGETFDFNEVVGPRDEANGYKVASVIAEGELVDGIGGGTCQISGTLHGAAFFAGLEIVERYPHTRPSAYIKMGLDATVVYPTINFRIKNGFPFPVVLHETVKNGVVRAEILGPKRTRTVTLIRRIDAAIPFDEVERPDKELPSGVRVLGQRGVAGFKLRRYRITRDGDHALRERWDDVYPPTSQIIRVGTGDMDKDKVKANDDPHPEYLADELLVVTQGADADGDGSSTTQRGGFTRESREAGKYGTEGWTRQAGMPYWQGKEKAARPADARPGSEQPEPHKPAKKKGKE